MQRIWKTSKYYDEARKGSEDISHPGMKLLRKLALQSKSVLDLGCGEGTRLSLILCRKNSGLGLDVSKKAISIARKKHPKIRFVKGSLEDLPFEKNGFDLVYSAYVLEHLTNVRKSLLEAIRVTKKDLVIICPNYGSPNRASPNYNKSRILKLICGFLNDFTTKSVDTWNKVQPKKNLGESNYLLDDDTTVEPYAHTLIDFLSMNDLKIIYWDTCWDYELPDAKLLQKLIRFFGSKNIFPFKYWGPHIVVHASKNLKI